MARTIPEGYELLSGRSGENARKALALAEDRGVDASQILTQTDGYLIPLDADSVDAVTFPSATPDGNPIANIAERQGDQTESHDDEGDVVVTDANTHDEIDAWAAAHDITWEGIEAENAAKPTKAEKIAHIAKTQEG